MRRCDASGFLFGRVSLQLVEQDRDEHGVALESAVVIVEQVVDEVARQWTRLEHGVACDEACHQVDRK